MHNHYQLLIIVGINPITGRRFWSCESEWGGALFFGGQLSNASEIQIMGLNGLKHCRIILLFFTFYFKFLIFYFTFLLGLELAMLSNVSVWSMLQCNVFMSDLLWLVLESLSKMICNCLKWQKSLHQQTICWRQQLYNKRQIHYKCNYLLNKSTKSVHDNLFLATYTVFQINTLNTKGSALTENCVWAKMHQSSGIRLGFACSIGKMMATVFSDQKGITQSLYQIVIQSSLWVHEGNTRKTDNLDMTMKTTRKHVCTNLFKVGIVQLRKEETIVKNVSGILKHFHLFKIVHLY